jgi:hypothetical protein
VQVKGYIAGQRVSSVELTSSSLSREISLNLGVVRGSAKVTVDWNEKNIKANVERCERRWVPFRWRWICRTSESIIYRW